jgi:hypothetical protein
VTDQDSHSALRQLRDRFSRPTPFVILAALAALLTVVGPFGTNNQLSNFEAFFYWLLISGGTYCIGFLIDAWLNPKLTKTLSKPLQVLALGLATSACITPFITVFNYLSLGYLPQAGGWLRETSEIFIVALIVTVVIHIITDSVQSGTAEDAVQGPALLDRLPFEKRGAIIGISSQDHYSNVMTTKGEELILLRFADAIREAAPTKGLQVHRSHWVATDHVTAAKREGSKPILILSSGGEIPVSRSYLSAVKQAGLLAG